MFLLAMSRLHMPVSKVGEFPGALVMIRDRIRERASAGNTDFKLISSSHSLAKSVLRGDKNPLIPKSLRNPGLL